MAEKSPSSSRGLIIGLSIAAAAVVLLFLVRSALHETVEVHTAKASLQNLTSTISTNGVVEPIEDYQAHAPAPGVIAKVYVGIGSHVERGSPLLKMDDSDARSRLASAQATLDGAVATLKNMQSGGTHDEQATATADLTAAQMQRQQAAMTLATTEALQAKGSASANEVAAAKQRLSDLDTRISLLQMRSHDRYGTNDLSVQKAQVEQARAALMAAQSAYTGVDIRAPFAGTVYSVAVSDYDFVPGGDALLDLADLTRMHVRAYFDEPDIGKLAAGQPVTIVWDAKPHLTWHGHIEMAPTTIETSGTRHVGECLITIDDAKGDLLPNTNVTIKVIVSQLVNVLSIPREALHTQGLNDFVYRVVDGHLKQTPIQVGANGVTVTRVQIASGLNDGDVVAISAPSNVELKDGLEVKAIP
jgi:HlyD family secretion protein